jgi:hypothetical protein
MYAGRGWPVFPCHTWAGGGCTCRRADCDGPARHPRTRHGLNDASLDPGQIRAWWRHWPTANIGIPTGVAFDVLDIDGLDGEENLNRLYVAAGSPGELWGPTVVTSRPGGRHLYVAPTGGGNHTDPKLHLDWRGLGGYVIAPGSVGAGGQYRWLRPDDPDCGPDAPIRPAPAWLLDLFAEKKAASVLRAAGDVPRPVSGRRRAQAALERACGRLAVAVVGSRNHTLNKEAHWLGRLAGAGQIDGIQAGYALLEVALRIGLHEKEAVATIRSGLVAGSRKPAVAAP